MIPIGSEHQAVILELLGSLLGLILGDVFNV